MRMSSDAQSWRRARFARGQPYRNRYNKTLLYELLEGLKRG
jgi:hypothetical protein